MKGSEDSIKLGESAEARDARLLLGAAKRMIRGGFLFLGLLGAILAPIMVHLLRPEQIEEMSLWVIIPAALCIIVYFSLEARWWWIREYRDAPPDKKTDQKYTEWK